MTYKSPDWDKLEAEARAKPEWQARYGKPCTLPDDWESMSLDRLYDALNSPDRYVGVARSTYDAIRYVIYDRGMKADPDWLLPRLARCSQAQIGELLTWIDSRNTNHAKDKSGHPISTDMRKLVEAFHAG